MTEYRFNNAIVRVHGTVDRENLKKNTTAYLKKAEAMKKRKLKAAQLSTAAEQRKGA